MKLQGDTDTEIPITVDMEILRENWSGYYQHVKANGIIRSTMAIASIHASAATLWMISRSHVRFSTTQHRLLLGMCIADIIYSLSASFFNAASPSDVNYQVWNARGNEATCTAQGFFQAFGTATSLLYSCSLNLYYLAVVKYQKPDEEIRTKLEPFLHGVPIAVALTLSIFGLPGQHFNDAGGGACWTPIYDPPHCKGYDDGIIPDGFEIPCGRGRSGGALVCYGLFFLLLFIPPIVIGTSLGSIYRAVLRQEKKLSKYGVGALQLVDSHNHGQDENPQCSIWSRVKCSLCFLSSSPRPSSGKSPPRRSRSNSTNSQSRAVLYKAVAYSLSYFLTWCFFLTGVTFSLLGKEWPNAIWYLCSIFTPLQGLYNFCIFIHPRLVSAKKKLERGGENSSWYRVFMAALLSRGKVDKKKNGVGAGAGAKDSRSNLRTTSLSQSKATSNEIIAPVTNVDHNDTTAATNKSDRTVR